MLTIEQTKRLLNNPQITDEQVEEIRNGFYALVEDVIFPAWFEERNKDKQKHDQHK